MKILFLGDMSPTESNFGLFDSMDIDRLFGDAVSIFKGNDFNVLNLEVALTESEKGIEKNGPCLKAPISTAETLKKVGVTHCLLSNNHTFDFGKKGLSDTVNALEKAGIIYSGIGENYEDSRKNLVLEKNGETVCVIAVCEHEYSYALEDRVGARPYDVFDTPKDVRDAKNKYDKVVVVYHGGKEHCRYPSPRLLKVCRNLVDNGADLVLCQHSHCVGCHEVYHNAHILYGQGNFLFAHNIYNKKFEGWTNGLAIIYDTATQELTHIFCVINDHGVELAKGEEKKELEDGFAQRNEILKENKWREEWHKYCETQAALYSTLLKKGAAAADDVGQYNIIGHLLDCEAHHDVLVELFPTANLTNEK